VPLSPSSIIWFSGLTKGGASATSLTVTGTYVPYGITQCYLPPGRADIPYRGRQLPPSAAGEGRQTTSPKHFMSNKHKNVCVTKLDEWAKCSLDAYRRKLLLFWLPTCLGICYPTAYPLSLSPVPPLKKWGTFYRSCPRAPRTLVTPLVAVMPCGWEGNRGSGVSRAMRHRLRLKLSIYWLTALEKEKITPLTLFFGYGTHFTAQRYASAVYAMAMCLSVCFSVTVCVCVCVCHTSVFH